MGDWLTSQNLRRLLGFTWPGQGHKRKHLVPESLCWIGHVCRMEDGRIPKDILYGELASEWGTRPSELSTLGYTVTCKRDLKACGINPADLEAVTSDRSIGDQGSRVASFPQRKGERASGRKKRILKCQRIQPGPAAPTTTAAAYICSKFQCSCRFRIGCTFTVDSAVQLTVCRKPLSFETEGCHPEQNRRKILACCVNVILG